MGKILKISKLSRTIFLEIILAFFIVNYNLSAQTVKNIILCIGDGMHLEHEIALSRYLYGMDKGLVWHNFPYQKPCTTWDITTYNQFAWELNSSSYSTTIFNPKIGYDASRGGAGPCPDFTTGKTSYFLTELANWEDFDSPAIPCTDSAAAATSLATGFKTDEGNIAWLPGDPANGSLKTIAENMRQKNGASIGVVTTVPFNHATPAAFISHNVSRSNLYTGYKGYLDKGIADEIINEVKPDVVIGSGHNIYTNTSWSNSDGYISRSLYNKLKNSNTDYIFAERQKGVNGSFTINSAATKAISRNKKLFGLFGGVTYRPNGQVYAADLFEPPVPVDIPGKPLINFSAAAVENPTLSSATVAALNVLSKNNKGFFLMIEGGDIDWANHSNDYKWMIGAMWRFNEAVKAVVDFVDKPGDSIDWTNTLIIVTADHANSYMRLPKTLGKGDLPTQNFISETSNWVYPDADVIYSITGHTNEPVMMYAKGAGSKLFDKYIGKWYPGTELIDNTHIYNIMAELTGTNTMPDSTCPQLKNKE